MAYTEEEKAILWQVSAAIWEKRKQKGLSQEAQDRK